MNQWNYQILEAYKQAKLFVAAFRFVKNLPLLEADFVKFLFCTSIRHFAHTRAHLELSYL